MNWYKKAQQMSFPFHTPEDEQIQQQNAQEREKQELLRTTSIQELIDDGYLQNERDLIQALETQGYSYEKISDFPEADPIYVVEGSNYPIVINNPEYPIDYDNAYDWVREKNEQDLIQYVSPVDKNEEFWSQVSSNDKVYHGTSRENIDLILSEGLEPRSETRGLSNKSMGSAVFASPSPEQAGEYYESIIEIDIGQMKQDGYTPNVGGEEPLEEEEMKSSLAHKIGLDEYIPEDFAGEGLDPETIVLHGNVPPKYLSLYKE